MDAQRALLDELMGTARNLTDEEKGGYRELKWDDDEVCACFMVRFCPHDLFVNTRSDLGFTDFTNPFRVAECWGNITTREIHLLSGLVLLYPPTFQVMQLINLIV
ncbi:hypothetical protein RND81_14G128400 [Saponaria officinalis]|uniref:Uncharacterized protein n=1 Tax=Saponaria officinalis TaxID=3572 RepID=A0AAW1GRP5_SAPOF